MRGAASARARDRSIDRSNEHGADRVCALDGEGRDGAVCRASDAPEAAPGRGTGTGTCPRAWTSSSRGSAAMRNRRGGRGVSVARGGRGRRRGGGGSGRRSARARWIDREGNARGFLASRDAAGRAEDAPERRGRRRRRWRSRGWSTANVPDERWTCAWRDGRVRARRRECRGRARFPDFDASRRSAARRIYLPLHCCRCLISRPDRRKTRACRIARRPHTSSRAVVTGCLSR